MFPILFLGFCKTFDNYRVELYLFSLLVTSRVHLSFLWSTQIANRKIIVSLSQLHLCSCRLHTWRILLLHVLFVYLLQVWYLKLFLTLQTLHLLLEAHCVLTSQGWQTGTSPWDIIPADVRMFVKMDILISRLVLAPTQGIFLLWYL